MLLKEGFHPTRLTENSPQHDLLVLGISVHTRECQVCFHPSGSLQLRALHDRWYVVLLGVYMNCVFLSVFSSVSSPSMWVIVSCKTLVINRDFWYAHPRPQKAPEWRMALVSMWRPASTACFYSFFLCLFVFCACSLIISLSFLLSTFSQSGFLNASVCLRLTSLCCVWCPSLKLYWVMHKMLSETSCFYGHLGKNAKWKKQVDWVPWHASLVCLSGFLLCLMLVWFVL